MGVSIKQRRWLLGGALLLTVAAAASVDSQDEADGGVVLADSTKVRAQHRQPERVASAEPTLDVLVDKLQRPALPENVKDMFAAKSWYVPPPAPKIQPPPSAPPLPFVYIGKMKEDGEKVTVFLERQSRIYLVHEGDAIDSNYRVDKVAAPLMTLTYLPLDIKQTVQIGEAN